MRKSIELLQSHTVQPPRSIQSTHATIIKCNPCVLHTGMEYPLPLYGGRIIMFRVGSWTFRHPNNTSPPLILHTQTPPWPDIINSLPPHHHLHTSLFFHSRHITTYFAFMLFHHVSFFLLLSSWQLDDRGQGRVWGDHVMELTDESDAALDVVHIQFPCVTTLQNMV